MRSIVTAALVTLSVALTACAPDGDDRTGPSVTFDTTPATTIAATTTAVELATPAVSFEPVVSSLQFPVDVAWRPGDDTMFVAQKIGTIVPVRDGVVGSPVLDVTAQLSTGVEQGLLGFTFSSDGALAYTNHTNVDGDTVITEFHVGTDGTFDAATARVLLTIEQPYDNHNGGNVVIGPDDMLYIGMGDGGSGGDPERRALNMSSLLGKILRIDPAPSGDEPYTVPADNPFVAVDGARPEIWAAGVRNPWRFSFDSMNGDLWIGDVGQNEWEEIDHAPAGELHSGGYGLNFGWSAYEGTHVFNADQSSDGITPPVYEYRHTTEDGCSVTGGAVYRGTEVPALVGWYVYADFCSGVVSALSPTLERITLGDLDAISAVRAAPNGELYVVDFTSGSVTQLQAA